jgi:hypothetical protein
MPALSPKRMATSRLRCAICHRAFLRRLPDHLDVVHDLLDVGDDLLCQLFLKDRAVRRMTTLEHNPRASKMPKNAEVFTAQQLRPIFLEDVAELLRKVHLESATIA